MFVGIIPSVLFWNQDLTQAFIAIAPYSYFFLFLFLMQANIKRDLILKMLLVFGYIGLVLFSYQLLFPKIVLFGASEELKEDRGVLRILFPGEGFMFFALVYYLNKLGKKFNWKYLIALLPFFLMMILQVTRMYILAFGVIAIYHFMIKSKLQYRVFAMIFFLAGFYYFYNSNNTIVKGMSEASENDFKQKEDYIRLQAAYYYLFDFPKNNSAYLIGNGAYHFSSPYGKKILSLNENDQYYLEDLGLVKGYVLFGFLFVFGYSWIFIKSFAIKIPDNKLYLKYYIWMILILSATTRANANAGFGSVMVTVLYLFEFANIEQKKLKNENAISLK